MRVLITNNTLAERAGSELYVRDLATALLRRGHQPVAFSTRLGPVAEELRQATVPVVSDLSNLAEPPDLIHGQHHLETMTALLHFPGVPAVFFCHGWLPWEEIPPRFPRILHYVAVDDTCRDRLVDEWGIAPERVGVILSFVDLARFRPRGPLPAAPRRALVFANTASEATQLPAIREACQRLGIPLDVVGLGSGRVLERPEDALPAYDLVFAKARAALEAMAVGAAVVACDAHGLAGLVTSARFDRLRRLNFGVRCLNRPLEIEALVAEIGRYDARDAACVSARVRAEASREQAVDRIERVYEDVLAAWRLQGAPDAEGELRAAARYLRWLGPEVKATRLWQERELLCERVRDLEARLEIATSKASQAAGLQALQAAPSVRDEELARIRGTLTWRAHERAFRSEGVRRLYRALRSLPADAGASPAREGGTPPAPVASEPPTVASEPVPGPAELSGLPEPAALQARFDGVGRSRFLGVPADGFARSGRMQLVALVRVGLTRTSRVLDFGCGCLRGGYWLIHYLEPGCYFGIEPHAERLAIGLEMLLEPGLAEQKWPRFDHSPDFDLAVFGERFDFVLADSIWTHAAKPQIRRMLDSLTAASHARTTLLASYLPAGTPLGPDYQGDEWVGTSHESDVPGVIRHDLGWILEECRRRGLSARELPEPAPDSQRWIEVTRA